MSEPKISISNENKYRMQGEQEMIFYNKRKNLRL